MKAVANLTYITGNKLLSPPITMWRLTKRCNLLCKHCSYHLNRDKIDTAKLREVAYKIAESGTEVVVITGGEPMIVPNIRELLSILKDAGKKIMINTNGYNLETFHDFFIEKEIDCITVSFDGMDAPTHDHIRGKSGSFDKAMESISYLRENRKGKKPFLAARAVVMKDNFQSLPDYISFFKEKVDEVKFQPVHDYEGFDEVVDKDVLFNAEQKDLEMQLELVMKEVMTSDEEYNSEYYKKFGQFLFHPEEMKTEALKHCMPVWFIFLCILEDGSCTSCAQKLGSIYENTVEEIWNGRKRLDYLTALSHQGHCNIPCWMTCTGKAGQAWQGSLIMKLLRLRSVNNDYMEEFKTTPNYTGLVPDIEKVEL